MAGCTCTPQVENPSGDDPVPVGQPYGFPVMMSFVDVGPASPPTCEPFAVVCQGTRNGVNGIGGGQSLRNAPGNHPKTVMTCNPDGASGDYIRYVLIYRTARFICSINSFDPGLQ